MEPDGTYVLVRGGGVTMQAAVDCVFPYENPVEYGCEEVPARVRKLVAGCCDHTAHVLAALNMPCIM